jgi:hypothetical protein
VGDLNDLSPSVFVTIQPSGRDDALAAAERVVGYLVDAQQARSLMEVLERFSSPCPEPAHISHIGVMMGRSVPAIRVHVSPLPFDAFPSFLGDIGWGGDEEEVRSLARLLLVHGDLVVLCFDVVAGNVLPRLGLECFFSQKHGMDPRWEPLLARLVALGLAAPDKAQALLRWPGTITPAAAEAPWPDELLVESLMRPADVFGAIDRRLSHVKLTWTAGAPVSAKAYFGFGGVWSAADGASNGSGEEASSGSAAGSADEVAQDISRRTAGRSPSAAPALSAQSASPAQSPADSVGAAVGRLLASRNQGGLWRDFFDRGRPAHADRRVTGYASDEWVTAYVSWALANVALPSARAAAENGLDLLLARRDDVPGWGYHALLPPDADTTTWVLRLAHDLGVPEDERLAAARRFVAGLVAPTGAVSTYERAAARPLAHFLRMEGTYEGWCATHTCVSAAAAVLDLSPAVLEFVRSAQRADGSWSGHWWDDNEYTTARAVEALAGHERDEPARRRAAAWAAGRISDDGSVLSAAAAGPSPFATALALHVVLTCTPDGRTETEAVGRATRWLISQQRPDGSWAPSARLRVPGPDVVDPLASPETTLTYVDDDALFTTATVLAALSKLPAAKA